MTLNINFYNDMDISQDDIKRMRDGNCWLEEGSKDEEIGFGWIKLPEFPIKEIQKVSDWLRSFKYIVQIGIGGSSLGNLMLHEAFFAPHYNEFPDDVRRAPKFYMADNIDEDENISIWNLIEPDKTAIIVVSKSGQTLETMSNFLFFLNKMKQVLGDEAYRRIVAITDSDRGLLVDFCNETGARRINLPSDVGGRYSVLSPVGLLSTAALGGDISRILKGAGDMKKIIFEEKAYDKNPAFMLAWNLMGQLRSGRPVTVFMPYGDRLNCLGEWLCQLWGESLGKNGGGPTPVRALGAIDQHSQLQLYSEGPDDKVYVLMGERPKNNGGEFRLEVQSEDSLVPLAYLNGMSMDSILYNEKRATTAVLAGKGRPLISIEFDELNEETLGRLIYLFQHVTALSGFLLCINPFDQPGVELGKSYTYGLSGRVGGEELREEVERVERIYLSRSVKLNI